MTSSTPCPNCQNPLPKGIPAGRCPHCLLLAAGHQTSAPGGRGRFVPPSVDDLDARLEDFEVLELIGQGGMGAVYKAIHLRLDRVVAIKVLPPELAESDPAFGERFLREARSLAKLQHPNLVVVHDFGEADGWFYIVMEYVEGSDLRRLIRNGELTPERTLEILPQICDGLRYAHAEGLVHRDIKPENILVGDDLRVRITDFGLARLVTPPAGEISLTGSAHTPGTPHYMAPEQLDDPENVDHRADIYALGVVLYEMLTGKLPRGRFPLPSKETSVGKQVDEVVLKSLEPNPEDRYQQADEVERALGEEFVTDEVAKQETPAPTPPIATPRLSSLESEQLAAEHPQLKKGIILGGIIFTAGFLPWGSIKLSRLNFEGSYDAFNQLSEGAPFWIPSWVIVFMGAAISVLAYLQTKEKMPLNWKILRRLSGLGLLYCLIAMGMSAFDFFSTANSSFRYSAVGAGGFNLQHAGEPEGFFGLQISRSIGFYLISFLYFYTWRFFRGILKKKDQLAKRQTKSKTRRSRFARNRAEQH